MQTIGRIIKLSDSAFSKYGNAIGTSILLEKANIIVRSFLPKSIGNKVEAKYIRKNTLFIACGASAIIQEIMLNQAKILGAISAIHSGVKVKSIRCVLNTWLSVHLMVKYIL